ncbi:MAG: radical SAM protein [Candidatus Margulisbacteria bacterium]|jgi:DNA repair photolyase|nr:radical SAM protein [Candidatus Margulisiibacteriota bacterium]
MQTIERKSLLYQTEVEYGDFTINHVQNCSHGCKYPCYAMLMAKRFGKIKSYAEWLEPKLVANTLELLDKEIPKQKDKIKFVHLCFSTDPFMYKYPEICAMSYKIIEKLNQNGLRCTALTKGLLPSELTNLSKENEFGITLITIQDKYRKIYEPGAAPMANRIERLRKLHEAGIKTWVSIEPYPTPNIIEQDFNGILDAVSFVDKIIFGRLNYNPLVSQYKEYQDFFNDLSYRVINFCKRNGKKWHIKEGTCLAKVIKEKELIFA